MELCEEWFRAYAAAQLASQACVRQKKNREPRPHTSNRKNRRRIPRRRSSILQIHRELGANLFKRAFKMNLKCFSKLYGIIKPELLKVMGRDRFNCRQHAINGIIPMPSRLGCALRFWAGGDPYDLAVVIGISYTEVFKSVNYICDAINRTKSLDIKYPETHTEQKNIVKGFKTKSSADFDCCAGCIDGLLIWIHMPTKLECEKVKVGQSKFVCGRKSKYGLNLQGHLW